MIVDPLKVALLWGWFTFLAFLAWLLVRRLVRLRLRNWSPKHQWPAFGAISVFVLLPGAVYLEIFRPMGGIYSAEVADYWIERALNETERSRKEAHVARIALSSEYGSIIARQAIDRVKNRHARCELRALLAGLPTVRDQAERQQEAKGECAAAGKS